MNDPLHTASAAILALVVFLFFLADIVEFIVWKYRQVRERLLK